MEKKQGDAYDIYFLLHKGIKANMDMDKMKLVRKILNLNLH